MIEAHLNMFDMSVLGIMALSCLFAFFRGFVREVISLGAWLGAAIITIYCLQDVSAKFQPYFKNESVAGGMAALAIYLISLMGFSLINMLILKFVKTGGDVGMLDNSFGLLFGALRGAFIVSLAFFLITIVWKEDEYPEWLKKSITRSYVEHGAIVLAGVAPDYLLELSHLKRKVEERTKQKKEDPIPQEPEDSLEEDFNRSIHNNAGDSQ